MHSHRWDARLPDWLVAVVAGFGAGGILMLLEIAWTLLAGGGSPWPLTRKIAAMMMGEDVLQAQGYGFSVLAMALAVHYVLGMAFGVVLACIIAPFHFDSSDAMVLLTGAVFGLLLYAFNFYVMVKVFWWIADLRGAPTVVAHLIFGMATAWMYRRLERPEPQR
ncbi:MAG: hypothetical protein V4508_22245 [Pseudomonadota bacterium]